MGTRFCNKFSFFSSNLCTFCQNGGGSDWFQLPPQFYPPPVSILGRCYNSSSSSDLLPERHSEFLFSLRASSISKPVLDRYSGVSGMPGRNVNKLKRSEIVSKHVARVKVTLFLEVRKKWKLIHRPNPKTLRLIFPLCHLTIRSVATTEAFSFPSE